MPIPSHQFPLLSVPILMLSAQPEGEMIAHFPTTIYQALGRETRPGPPVGVCLPPPWPGQPVPPALLGSAEGELAKDNGDQEKAE